MIVSELRLYNFRKFHADNGEPGLLISFHKGLSSVTYAEHVYGVEKVLPQKRTGWHFPCCLQI